MAINYYVCIVVNRTITTKTTTTTTLTTTTKQPAQQQTWYLVPCTFCEYFNHGGRFFFVFVRDADNGAFDSAAATNRHGNHGFV